MTIYVFKGEEFTPHQLTESLIRRGFAAPAAREMDVDEVIRQIVDQCFLDEWDAPVKIPALNNRPVQPRPVDGEYKVVNYPEGCGY